MAVFTTVLNLICNADVRNLLLLVLFCTGLWFYINLMWNKRNQFIKSWNVPGPFNFPIIGSAYVLMCRKERVLDNVLSVLEKYPAGGKVWFGYMLVYLITEPQHIKQILTNHKFVTKDIMAYKELKECIGEGILIAPNNNKWRRHRRTILPSFNQHVLNSLVDKMTEKSLILAEALAENCGNKLNVENLLYRCTFDSICENLTGVDLDASKRNPEYANTIEKMLPFAFNKVRGKYVCLDLFGYDNKKLRTQIENLNDISLQVIQKKIESNNQRKVSCDYAETASSKRLPLLDHIMESGGFNDKELRDEINTFFVAGIDTSAATLTFLSMVLGMFPDIQQKVYEEMIQILGNDRLPGHQDLNKMIYTDRVIKETLRLFPPVPVFFRKITEDTDVGEFKIPQDALVMFGVQFIHRNPKYWPDPLKFDPDRFLPEKVSKRHPCTYVPFSFGPRNCIGKKYAVMNVMVVLSTIVRKFRIHCEYKRIEDVKINSSFTLKIRDGAKVSMTPR